jgi:hypothetical protein
LTSSSAADGGTSDVPTRIFEKFLQALEGASVSADVVARLRNTLFEDRAFSENALKKAVLGENAGP